MYNLANLFNKLIIPAIILCCAIFDAAQIYAQGKQAVIILKPSTTGAQMSGCDSITDLNYQIVNDIKINNKEEIRLLSGIAASSSVSRKDYENAGKSKLKDLSALIFDNDGLLYAVSINGQTPILALPDEMKPQKNSEQPLSSFYGVTLSGEVSDAKQKRKVSLALRELSRIYFVSPGAAINDLLFRYAVEAKSVALWEAYLRKTNNYRSNEANSYLRDALIICAKTDFDSFLQGNYSSLEKAQQKLTRVQAVSDNETSRQLATMVRQAQEKLDRARGQVDQLIRASKWDEALASAESIKIYLQTWPDLNNMYNYALKQSHEIHLFKGGEALRGDQLEVALDECSMALQRLPDSGEAQACLCETRNRIALRDSANLRQQKRPKDAKELLEKQLAETKCAKDARVTEALKIAACEYSQQLFTEARQLIVVTGAAQNQVTVPSRPTAAGKRGQKRGAQKSIQQPQSESVKLAVKSITAQNKNDFRNARAKLIQCNQICNDEPANILLDDANRKLSEYCLTEARKSMQRNEVGTAYVYLLSAQEYTPNDEIVLDLLGKARERFEEQTRISIGVVFKDISRSNVSELVLNEITAEIESIVTQAGLAQPVILDHGQASQVMKTIQAGRASLTPTVIFSCELLGANINRRANQRSVRSTFSYANPQREEWDRKIDVMNREIENCSKQYGDAACNGLRDQRSKMRAYRDSLPRTLSQPYSYTETSIVAKGNLKISFRATDSISRSVRAADNIEEYVDQQCVQREGVNDRDSAGARNSICQLPDEQTCLSMMLNKVKNETRSKALSQLSELPLRYYTRAKNSANRQQAVEDFILFLFLSNKKVSSESQEAQNFLTSYDSELKTGGIIQ